MTDQEIHYLIDSPFRPVFVLIGAERKRSELIHGTWEGKKYTARAMSALAKGELSEVDIAIELRQYREVITEFIHTANVSCKAVTELLRRWNISA